MRGSWWRWLSAVLAAFFGLAFGWVAGTGLVQAAGVAVGTAAEPAASVSAATAARSGEESPAGRRTAGPPVLPGD